MIVQLSGKSRLIFLWMVEVGCENDEDDELHVDRLESRNMNKKWWIFMRMIIENDEDDDEGSHVDGLEEHEHEADGEEIVNRNGNHSAARFCLTKLRKDGNGNTKKSNDGCDG